MLMMVIVFDKTMLLSLLPPQQAACLEPKVKTVKTGQRRRGGYLETTRQKSFLTARLREMMERTSCGARVRHNQMKTRR